MNQDIGTLTSAITADLGVNLWGALGCSVAFAASMFAILDALGDYAQSRSDTATVWQSTGNRLKFGSKLSASGITAIAAGIVLALDNNWWALVALVVVFVIVVSWSVLALARANSVSRTMGELQS